MALSRRSTHRVSTSIWPGFVDAMTALLLVMMFLLTIFMVVQFVLREEISGQESRLDTLTDEISGLTDALGLANARADAAAGQRDALQAATREQNDTIGALRADLADETGRAASFEAQVATLLAGRDTDRVRIVDLEAREQELVSDRQALDLALATARSEIDAQTEAARLAAARREALEALITDLRARIADREARTASLSGELEDARASLSAEEEARLVEAAAAEALRARLAASEAELTAMSLALEEQRARAEETLTLLAAAEAAEADLDLRLAAALTVGEQSAEAAADLDRRLSAALLAQDRSEETVATLSVSLDAAEADRAALEDGLAAATEERDRTADRLSAALSRLDDRTRELADISGALDAARAARMAYAGDLESARAELDAAEAEVAALREATGDQATERDRLAAALEAARAEAAALQARGEDQASLRDQLAEALVRQRAAQAEAAERLSQAQRREMLLATARRELDQQQAITEEGQKRLAALSAEVATLRREVAGLKAVLDVAADESVAQDAEIDDLTGELNTALARVAAEQRRRAELESAERQRLERYQSEFFGRLREVLGDREGVKIAGDRFVFDSEVLFPSGSARLSDAGREQIRGVAALLTDISDEIPDSIDWVIRVDGHTDDVPLIGNGRYADNWELSQARALSVVRFMSEDLGFPPRRLAPTGFGEYRPIALGTSPRARALNRRIELKLTER